MNDQDWQPGDAVEWHRHPGALDPTPEPQRGIVIAWDPETCGGPPMPDRTPVRHLDDLSVGLVKTWLLRPALPDGSYDAICEAFHANGCQFEQMLPHGPRWHMDQAEAAAYALLRARALSDQTNGPVES